MSLQPSTLNSQPALRLHIERLVLDGLPLAGRDAAAFRSSLEAELGRLIQERQFGVAGLGSAMLRSLPAGTFDLEPAAGPALNGRRAAAALYHALGPVVTGVEGGAAHSPGTSSPEPQS